MRLARFRDTHGAVRIGAQADADHLAALPTGENTREPLLGFLNSTGYDRVAERAVETATREIGKNKPAKNSQEVFRSDQVTILPPIARPSKIICMGGNFSDHLQEGSTSLPPFPISFLKSPTSLIGHKAPVIYPGKVKLLDYEVELAAIIGRECHNVSRKNALENVAGYSVFNDISARDFQFSEMKRGFCNIGKNFATFAPMGPYLVTPDQAGNPDNLSMELRVNGRTRQLSNTKNMVFKLRELVEFFSSMILEPGDVITSGTPSGVAIYRKPDKTPFLLKPEDMVESKVENLGVLQNRVEAQTEKIVSPIIAQV